MDVTKETEKLCTIEDLRAMLGIGRNTAYTLLKENKVKAFKVGGHWIIPESSIREFIDQSINSTTI